MADSLPTVAVVIPTYNVGAYISAALESVANQTLPPDEVILVDDASHDDTVEQAKAWLHRLPLRIIELDVNIGCGAARGTAVSAATSDVIAPFDGDDVWLPDHLEINLPLASPNTIVGVAAFRWDGKNKRHAAPEWEVIPDPDDQPDVIIEHDFLFSGSMHWRTALTGAAGGPSQLRSGEDFDNWIRLICLAGCRAIPSPKPTVLYRSRIDSLSANEGSVSGCLEMYSGYLANQTLPVDPKRLRFMVRRCRARLLYTAALETAVEGKPWRARLELLRAGVLDRSFHGWLQPAQEGSVLLRSLVACVAPTRAARRRARRMTADGFALEKT